MIQKTGNLDIFIFIDDNRAKIDLNHVEKLCQSIKSRNLLDLRPIAVNEKMEIIDGQHRVLAAKKLGLEIYYQVQKSLEAKDILLMNISKSWGKADYLNFYCSHKYPEYLKLQEFMKKNNLTLNVALNIVAGRNHNIRELFRDGKFIMEDIPASEALEICWDTIGYIKKMNGFSNYTNSSRFWKALLKLINHPEFNLTHWLANIQKLVSNFSPKATTQDYLKMISYIYNWKSREKIDIGEEE